MSKILVTGGAGFIGSHVSKALLDRGDEVIVVDNFNSYYDPNLKEDRVKTFFKNYKPKVYRVDISKFEQLSQVFAEDKIDKICHLAAQAGVRYSLENPDVYIQSNIIGTHNLLELAREFNIRDFIFASSSSVYGGNQKLPFAESDRVDQPVSLYAATKKASELELYSYHHLYDMNVTVLRFFTVYGPWGRPDMAAFLFADAITSGKILKVFNQGKMKRDFTYIDDIVQGVVAAIDKNQGYEIYNLGNNNPTDLEYYIELFEKALGKKANKKYLPLQPGDVVETYADIEKARKDLGFEPKTSIEQGVEKFLEWYKDYSKNS